MRSLLVRFVLFWVNNVFNGSRFFGIKRGLLRLLGVKIGKGTKIVAPVYFGPSIAITIGENCWISMNVFFDGNGAVILGNNIDIAPHVVFNTGGHEIGTPTRRAGKAKVCTVTVGDGTWIGTRVVIINDVNVSEGVVVAAGAVVHKNVESNVVIAGVPFQIKKRL